VARCTSPISSISLNMVLVPSRNIKWSSVMMMFIFLLKIFNLMEYQLCSVPELLSISK
jgi:hypothetical protein